jgi:hypothetical protein
MGNLTLFLALLAGFSLTAEASIPKGHETEELRQPVLQKCPELRGRYTCRDSFMLSYKRKKKHEMRVVQSERDGFQIYLFEAHDGVDGFWAVGDSFPHAYESEVMQAWGFKEIDSEASCPKPESLEIRFMVLPGSKPALSSAHAMKGKAVQLPRTSGMLTFWEKSPGIVQVTARAFAGGRRPLLETTTCQRVGDPYEGALP